jgi:hypothetical protein
VYSRLAVSVIVAVGCALAIGTVRGESVKAPVAPCSLLTTAEVSSAIGGKADPGTPIYTTGCQWKSTSPRKAMVTISLQSASTWASMKSASSPMIVKTPLSGVGDDAFFKVLGPIVTLTVKKGNVAFVVRVYGVDDQEKQKQIDKTLAAEVAAKL